MSTERDRGLDVVLFGATGFVGRLTVKHLVHGAPAAPFAETSRTPVEGAEVLTADPKGERHGDQPAAVPQ